MKKCCHADGLLLFRSTGKSFFLINHPTGYSDTGTSHGKFILKTLIIDNLELYVYTLIITGINTNNIYNYETICDSFTQRP